MKAFLAARYSTQNAGTLQQIQILHLKAIEVAGKYLPPDNDFFTHLLNSFNKNYKCLMDEIVTE